MAWTSAALWGWGRGCLWPPSSCERRWLSLPVPWLMIAQVSAWLRRCSSFGGRSRGVCRVRCLALPHRCCNLLICTLVFPCVLLRLWASSALTARFPVQFFPCGRLLPVRAERAVRFARARQPGDFGGAGGCWRSSLHPGHTPRFGTPAALKPLPNLTAGTSRPPHSLPPIKSHASCAGVGVIRVQSLAISYPA
jgi:hypothetical protein